MSQDTKAGLVFLILLILVVALMGTLGALETKAKGEYRTKYRALMWEAADRGYAKYNPEDQSFEWLEEEESD